MDIIDRINECLSKSGKTGAEMSRDIGLSNSIYSQWNTKKTSPSNKNLVKIAEYLGVSVEFLKKGVEQKEKSSTQKDAGFKSSSKRLADITMRDGFKEKDLELLITLAEEMWNRRDEDGDKI